MRSATRRSRSREPATSADRAGSTSFRCYNSSTITASPDGWVTIASSSTIRRPAMSSSSERSTAPTPARGEGMKFRAVKAADAATADVSIVPLFDDKQIAKTLPRGKRAIVERLAAERGASTLYNVFTHVGGDRDGRVVVVGAGKRADYDAERARSIASAGIKSLWKTDAKTVAIHVDPTSIGE